MPTGTPIELSSAARPLLEQDATNLKGKDVIDQSLPEDEAGAGHSVAQEDLEETQRQKEGLRREEGPPRPESRAGVSRSSPDERRAPWPQAFLPQDVPALGHGSCVQPPTAVLFNKTYKSQSWPGGGGARL